MSYICGPCGVGNHKGCNGLLRAQYDFCACFTRGHQPKPDDQDPAVRARNEAIYLESIRHTLHAGEA